MSTKKKGKLNGGKGKCRRKLFPLSKIHVKLGFGTGVYILVQKIYLFSPPLLKMIFSPSCDIDSCHGLFALILPYFAFILPFYFPFFLSPFFLFLSLSSFFFSFFLFLPFSFPFLLLSFPFLTFLLHFPPFPLSLFIFSPQMTLADIPGGGGVFSTRFGI